MSSEDGEGGQDGGRMRKLKEEINDVWNKIEMKEEKIKPEVDNRPGWKTVRIFVSSTFKDFHQEREELVKKVFAELRVWCELRQLYLIDCDLRWGVPKETTSEKTIRTCLEEIDRCYEDNKVPYFVNMTCKRIGWIPVASELPPNLLDSYQLVFGLSVTEMEIVHAAYRIENPNALFLIRDDSFLNEIEDESIRKEFIDETQPQADTKLDVLKDKIKSHFSEDRVFTYKCEYVPGERLYSDYMTKKGRPKLKLDENFSKTVLDFFKKRIGEQYPPVTKQVDKYLDAAFHHEAFMKSRCEIILGANKRSRDMVVGREDILKEISKYVEDVNEISGYPKLIVGEAGAGKSSIMAKAARTALLQMDRSPQLCKVFFHFVGAVPNSTSLLEILRRLLKEIQPDTDLPETLEETEQIVRSELTRNHSNRIVIFIDALNQIDEETRVEPMFWLPEVLGQNVRCVLSLITHSEPHKALKKRKDFQSEKVEIPVLDLDANKRLEIVNGYLGLFSKTLTAEQVVPLLTKEASRNPLWLRIACEELRLYGDFGSVTEYITLMEGTLKGLLQQVLRRFEKETDRVLLVSTLCLLEASRFGLLEFELLEILTDRENLEYRESSKERCSEESQVTEKRPHLPYADWAGVYRNLRIFLRPYGNPGEGRLDFYHSTLKEVVQDLYLDKQKSEAGYNEQLCWWHKKLADYYCSSGTFERKVEEYPHHLLFLKNHSKGTGDKKFYCKWLQDFLRDMRTFKQLFNDEFSETLLFYWRESGDENYEQMCSCYVGEIRAMQKDFAYTPSDITARFEDVSRLVVQAGKYKDGLALAEECIDMVEKFPDQFEKEERSEKLMYLYGHIARIKSFLLPPTQSAKEIPELQAIIECHNKAIQIVNSSGKKEDKKYKKFLALQLDKTAYARGGIASRSDELTWSNLFSGKKTKREMIDQGCKEVEMAISIYQELKDFGRELGAQITKATLYRGNKDEQLEIYEKTRQRCCQIFGEEHHMMCTLCFNTGIVYEDAKDTANAYKYFRMALSIGSKVFGPKHRMTQMYRDTLKEKKYAALAKKHGDTMD